MLLLKVWLSLFKDWFWISSYWLSLLLLILLVLLVLLSGKGVLAFWLLFNGDDWNAFGFPNLGPGLEDEKGFVILLLGLGVLLNWFWLDLWGGKWEDVDALLLKLL